MQWKCSRNTAGMWKKMLRTYSELITIPTFMERFKYLKLNGRVGEETFGFDRYLNQTFYRSYEWRRLRDEIIVRDCGCDLAMEDREIFDRILIHHMNPIQANDILQHSDMLLNPEYLICTSKLTHDAIHYGDEQILYQEPVTRTQGDTCPWK